MDLPRLFSTGSRALTGDVDGTAANAKPEPNTADASANTDGSWVETFSSTPFDAFGMLVSLCAETTNADRLVDIGIGAGGSEIVLVEDLPACRTTSMTWCDHAYLPIKIKEGSRLAHRSRATTGSATTLVGMTLLGGGFVGRHGGHSLCTTFGANGADSGGTQIDPGGTAGTKGSWVQIPSSTTTTQMTRAIMVGVGNVANTSRASNNWLVDIGIGGAGSEQVILSNLHCHAEVSGIVTPRFFGPIPVSVAIGSQFSARCVCSITDATDRLLDVIIYAFS